jgi:hypothetical protein
VEFAWMIFSLNIVFLPIVSFLAFCGPHGNAVVAISTVAILGCLATHSILVFAHTWELQSPQEHLRQ